jgi:hypothetical protein
MIKMRINNQETSHCEECGTSYKYTPEMYDLMICNQKMTLCKKCIDTLFTKTLKASCIYNAKLKSPADMKRIQRSAERE